MYNGRLLYAQVIFVVIAFAIMVFTSYLFGQRRENDHIDNEIDSMFFNIEEQLTADLNELKTMLGIVSETINQMIKREADFSEVTDYITAITDYGHESLGVPGFVSVFGAFDVYGRQGFSGIDPKRDWQETGESREFVAEQRLWYIEAEKSSGEIRVTDPYEDILSGEIIFAYVRPLFDEDGERTAIICINVSLNRIYEFAMKSSASSISYWMLFDREMNIIAHPNPTLLGRNLHDTDKKYAETAEILPLSIENGWYMGVVASMEDFHRFQQSMLIFLGSLGAVLAALLSLTLVRLVASRNRAEERTRVLLDAVPLVVNYWNNQHQIILTNSQAQKVFKLKDKQEYVDRFMELSPEYQPDGSLSSQKAIEYVKKAFNEGNCQFEWMHQTLKGEKIPSMITLVRAKHRGSYIVAGYMRDLREEQEMAHKLTVRDNLLRTVNNIASALLSMKNEETFEDFLHESMEYIGKCTDVDRVLIWRGSANEQVLFLRYEWLSDYGKNVEPLPVGFGFPYEAIPTWGNIFKEGGTIHGPVSGMADNVQALLGAYQMKSILVIPLFSNEKFWGMFTIDNCREERFFSEEEINILQSAGLMMMHALNRSEMLEKINEDHIKTEELAHRYHSILDTIPLPISVMDEEMNWTFVNRAVENFLGMKRKDLIGWQCSTWGSEICNTHRCGVACLKRGEKQTFFTHNEHSFKVDVETLTDLNGETAGYIEIVQDITEIKTMAKRHADIEAASNAKSAFLATVSHEIRTPMNTILGIAEIQLQSDKHKPEVEDAFNQICDSGDLLLNIINDILDLSKIEANKLDINLVRYDIPSLINDSAQLNYLRYESKPLKFTINLAADTPLEFHGDDFRIKQILNNLLSNAFKYTDTGEVELSVSAEPILTRTPSEAEKLDTTLIIRVRDTGIGMSDEQINRLFDEFTRFNDTRTTVGTGLGMSITKRLVDMMSGKIKVESVPGEGSVFEIRLPQKRISSEICGTDISDKFKDFNFKSRARLKKAQIIREYMPYGSVLIVDDVSLNLQVAKGMLAPYSLKIDAVMSGLEAIEMVKAGKKYDIIFMDHMMPVMNGVEATKILREYGYKQPIVALTANALAGQEEMFLENGFDAFVSKPIDSRELNKILNDFIRNRKPKEVVDSARLAQSERENNSLSSSAPAAVNNKVKIPGLEKYFVKDAENAVNVLEGIIPEIHSADETEMELYVTTVHGMKSALANIDEGELSGAAFKLEQAGKERNLTLITNKTPVFISVLKSLIEKFKPGIGNVSSALSAEDTEYLRERLLEIKTSCDNYDKQIAKEAMTELKQRTWTAEINKALDEIDAHLLHSAFKKAAAVAEKTTELCN
jgi:PAS domain S-box-containing protein